MEGFDSGREMLLHYCRRIDLSQERCGQGWGSEGEDGRTSGRERVIIHYIMKGIA
jgi:hypothetical protein